MKALLIGCGEGGSKLVEHIMKIQYATFGEKDGKPIKKQFDAIILNTASSDLEKIDPSLRLIDMNRRLLIGSGFTPAAGHGAGGNPRIGTLAAQRDYWRIAAKIEEILSEINSNPDMTDINAFIICAALGGGSGSGMGPVIAKLLKENYFEDQYPVIGLVILPAPEEGDLYAYNAYGSLLTWLKESNFDGIITVTLGGKFLNYKDDSLRYYSKFDKSIAKALYILFGGEALGEKSVNVDVSDILSTIKDGGGICTLGHLSTVIVPRGKKETSETKSEVEVLGEEEEVETEEGWEVQELLKALKRTCNKNNLFLPVNFQNSKAALLVVKDSPTFNVTKGAMQTAGKWLEDNIQGVVRYSDISHRDFRLIADNRNNSIFEDYEISEEDVNLSDGKTVEIALLLSGISDVPLLRKFKEVAERLERITRPPKGERLVSETFGFPIGKGVNTSFLLPCSSERDNLASSFQSKASIEAFNKFVKELSILHPDLDESDIRRYTKIIDVKPIPDEVKCGDYSIGVKIPECYEVNLRFENGLQNIYFKRKIILRVKASRIEQTPAGQCITWGPTDFLRVVDNWSDEERTVIDDVVTYAIKERKFRDIGATGATAEREDLCVSGLGIYPSCNGNSKVGTKIYKVKVTYVKKVIQDMFSKDQTEREEERMRIQKSVSEDPCGEVHGKYFKYFYWVKAEPHPEVFSCEEMQQNKVVELDNTPLDQVIFRKDERIMETREVNEIKRLLDEHEDFTCEKIRDEIALRELLSHTTDIDNLLNKISEEENVKRRELARLVEERGWKEEDEEIKVTSEEQKIYESTLKKVEDIKKLSPKLRPKLRERVFTLLKNTLEIILESDLNTKKEKLEAIEKLSYVLDNLPPNKQDDLLDFLKRRRELTTKMLEDFEEIYRGSKKETEKLEMGE